MAFLNTDIGPERVQVFDQALGTVQVPGASISTASFIISTSEAGAPENTPTAVTSLEEFVDSFGGPDEVANDAYYAVKGYYDNAGSGARAIIVNVGASATPTDYVGDAAAGTGLRALDDLDEVGMVMVPGLPLEEAYLVHGALIDYSETIRAEFGSTLSTAFSLLAMPKEITKSESDTTLTTGQLIDISGAGPYVMNINLEASAVAASGTITITSFADLLPTAGDTIEVAGVVFTAQAGAVTPGDATFQAVTDNDTTAQSLADQINAHATASALVTAGSVTAGAFTVTADDPGDAGNSLTLVYTDNGAEIGATVSGSGTLAGGADGSLDLSSITPGMIAVDSGGTNKFVISAVDDGADTISVITDPSSAFSPGDDVLIKLPSAVTYKEDMINNPSRVAAWYFNQVVVSDLSDGASAGDTVTSDPSGHVAGIINRIDANRQIGGHSHAPAGQRFAGISGILALQLSLSERKDGEPLRTNFINRITSFAGAGNVVFGGYTADSGTSPGFTADEQLIQVMRTLQYVKASLEPGLRSFLWENFSPATQSQVSSAISSFLRSNIHLFPVGLPENQQFKVIPVEPTQDELDKGLLRVRVQVRPNKAIRFIEVTLEFPLPAA